MVVAQPNSSQTNSVVKLTPIQLKVSRSVGLRVALPSYIPANFHANEVIVSAGRENVESLRYLVVYQNLSTDQCFAIESAILICGSDCITFLCWLDTYI